MIASPTLKAKKQLLGQYRRLLKEIAYDRLRLGQLTGRLLRQNPAGLPDGAGTLSVAELGAYRARVEENMARCCALVERLQAFINQIPDSETRRIFTLHYINGYTWQRVAYAIGGYDESHPRKKHDRYLAHITPEEMQLLAPAPHAAGSAPDRQGASYDDLPETAE